MPVKRFLPLLVIIWIAAVLTGCAPASEEQALVVRVIDGDTIEISGGARVRYIGIDTPEVYPELEYYGAEAREKNAEMVEGKIVVLEKDVSDRDRYGRLLRYVYVDGTFVNGVRITQPVRMRDGDMLQVGDTQLVFHTHPSPYSPHADDAVGYSPSPPIQSAVPSPAPDSLPQPVGAVGKLPTWAWVGCVLLIIISLLVIVALTTGILIGQGVGGV